jgi:hypothetical protein
LAAAQRAGLFFAQREIVGYATPPAAPITKAFLWRPGQVMLALPDLPGGQDFAIAWDINDEGWIVGTSISDISDGPVLWTPDGEIIDLGDLYPGPSSFGEAYAINDREQVVGLAGSAPENEAFLWDAEEGMIGLGRITDSWSAAYDINNREQVVGISYSWADGAPIGFIWDRRHGMRRLDTLLDPCAAPTYTMLCHTWAINDRGQIVSMPYDNLPSVLLTPYLPGDLDEQGRVTLKDLAIQLSNFGRIGDAAYPDGDLDCDRDVDLDDLAILLSNLGESLP